MEDKDKIKQLRRRIRELEGVCAEAYQLAGVAGALQSLDNLSDAMVGRKLRHKTFLPINENDLELGKELAALRQLFKEADEWLRLWVVNSEPEEIRPTNALRELTRTFLSRPEVLALGKGQEVAGS